MNALRANLGFRIGELRGTGPTHNCEFALVRQADHEPPLALPIRGKKAGRVASGLLDAWFAERELPCGRLLPDGSMWRRLVAALRTSRLAT